MRVTAVLVCLAAAACAVAAEKTPDPVQVAAVRHDSAGIEIVESSGPTWNAEEAWKVDSAPRLTFVAAESETRYTMSSISQVMRLDDGRYLVLCTRPGELLLLDQKGQFIRTIGRKGEGPGEWLRYPSAMARADSGTVHVWGSDNWTLNLFDTTGRVLSTRLTDIAGILHTMGPGHYTENFTPVVGGGLVANVTLGNQKRTPGEMYRSSKGFLLANPGQPPVMLGWYGGWRNIAPTPGKKRTNPFSGLPTVNVDSYLGAGGTPLRVFVSGGDSSEVRVFDATGKLIRLLRPQVPLLEVDYSKVERGMYISSGTSYQPPTAEQQAAANEGIPDIKYWPKTVGMIVDRLGYLWIEFTGLGWNVFDGKGEWLGATELPKGHIFEIGEDYILVRKWERNGEEGVLEYGLNRKKSVATP